MDSESAATVYFENDVNEERDSSELLKGRALKRCPVPLPPSPAIKMQ
jgi:hypothetical protein